MRKKVLSGFLAFAVALGMLTTAAPAAEMAYEITEIVPAGKYDYFLLSWESELTGITGAQWGTFDRFIPVWTGETGTGKWGLIDVTGKELVPCKYDFLGCVGRFDFDGSSVFLVNVGGSYTPSSGGWGDGILSDNMGVNGGKYGFIDSTGKEIVAPKYTGIDYAEEGFIRASVGEYPDKKWGFLDTKFKEAIPFQYDYADIFRGETAIVEQNGETFMINKTGARVQNTEVDGGYNGKNNNLYYSKGLTIKVQDGKYGYVDENGNQVIPAQYDSAYGFEDGLAWVKQDGKWGRIDTAGREIIPFKYEDIQYTGTGKAEWKIKLNGKWGLIDGTGKEIVPCKYEIVSSNEDGNFFAVGTNKVDHYGAFSDGTQYLERTTYDWGVVDRNGNEIITPQYEDICIGADGLVAIMKNGKCGLLAITEKDPASEPIPTPTPNPTPAITKTAKENVQIVRVDGKDVSFAMYSPDNGGTNYVRLVDLAVVLKDTAGKFNVGYDRKLNRVLLTSGEAYEGPSSVAPFHSEMEYEMMREPTYVDGVARNLEALRFEYNGGGYTYYKLRALGEALGFNVGWDRANQRIYIESGKPYDPNN